MQEEHFLYLSRDSRYLCTSLKEKVWVVQGKGRQNRELRREIFGVLVAVGIIDLTVTMN